MSARQRLEERLQRAGIPLDSLSQISGIAPTIVLTVGYTTSGDLSVTHIAPCDTAVHFQGVYYPLPGVTLLVEHGVAEDLGLTSRPEYPIIAPRQTFMRRLSFSLFWLLAALTVGAFLEGVTLFCLAIVGLNLQQSVLVSALHWAFPLVLFSITLVLCLCGRLPGTEPRQRS